MSPLNYKNSVEHFKRTLLSWQEERNEIQIRTSKQIKGDEWIIKTKKILITPHFGQICKKQKASKCAPIVSSILYPKSHLSKDEMHKFLHKKEVLADFVVETNLEVVECGLVIDKNINYFGASPEWLKGSDGLIMLFCPYDAFEMTVEEGRTKQKSSLHLILNII